MLSLFTTSSFTQSKLRCCSLRPPCNYLIKSEKYLLRGSGICGVVLACNILIYASKLQCCSLRPLKICLRCQTVGCHLFSRFGEENPSSTLVSLCLPLGTVALFRVSPQSKRLNLLPKRNARRRLREQIIYQS